MPNFASTKVFLAIRRKIDFKLWEYLVLVSGAFFRVLKTIIPLHFDAVKCKLKQNLNFDKIVIVIGALPPSVIYKQN